MLPYDVDDVIADLAYVFGRTPAVCDGMGLGELMMWHDKAVKRSTPPK